MSEPERPLTGLERARDFSRKLRKTSERARTVGDSLHAFVLLFFLQFIAAAFIWAFLPVPKEYALFTAPVCFLGVPFLTITLIVVAWRAELARGRNVSKFEIAEELLATMLMLEGGATFAFLMAIYLWRERAVAIETRDYQFAFGALIVSLAVCAAGFTKYVRRVGLASESRIEMPKE